MAQGQPKQQQQQKSTTPAVSKPALYETIKSAIGPGTELRKIIEKLVTKNFDLNKFFQIVLLELRNNDKLMQCEKGTIYQCIHGAAELQLMFGRHLGQIYMVPYWNEKRGRYEAQLIIGYKGYLTLARNTGELSTISAHEVYTNDKFEYEYGLDERLVHIPAEGARGNFKAVYCIFTYKDGSKDFEVMHKDKIDSVRNRSKAKDSGPWVTDYDEMAIKTVIRHHIKYCALSADKGDKLMKASYIEEQALIGENQFDMIEESEIKDKKEELADKTKEAYEFFETLVKEKEMQGWNAKEQRPILDVFLVEMSKTYPMDAIMVEATKTSDTFESFWAGFQDFAKGFKAEEKKK